MSGKKRALQIALFLLIMVLTFYALLGDRPGNRENVPVVSDTFRRFGHIFCMCGGVYDLVSAPGDESE